ncbi:hypothetical protein HMPREF1570_3970 [Klebsiella oxytoca KA-2]|nr:hypothetical protein HMPREF1570_3970 [Klebsiella oxytoca KA-2]
MSITFLHFKFSDLTIGSCSHFLTGKKKKHNRLILKKIIKNLRTDKVIHFCRQCDRLQYLKIHL